MERVVGAGLVAAGFFGSGLVIMGQAVFDSQAAAVERIIGGSVIIAAGYVIIRWMFKLLGAVREDSTATRATLAEEREAWREERDSLRSMMAEQKVLYEAEKTLRISLEAQMGPDRRNRDPEVRK